MVLSDFFSCFLFFRRQGFRMITFDRQGSRIWAGQRKKCIVFRPRATPGWGRGVPQKIVCVSEPQEHFWRKKLFFAPPPQFFFCVLEPQEHFF